MLNLAAIADGVSSRFVVITGASGGGKSSLLAELERRGRKVVAEPGRRIVASERQGAGSALPWNDLETFARKAIELALADRVDAAGRISPDEFIFFDRSLVDAAAALVHATGEPVLERIAGPHRYAQTVFMAPPWREIFQQDAERQHDFADGEAEYHRLVAAYARLGYRLCELPKLSLEERADFVLSRLRGPGSDA